MNAESFHKFMHQMLDTQDRLHKSLDEVSKLFDEKLHRKDQKTALKAHRLMKRQKRVNLENNLAIISTINTRAKKLVAMEGK